MFIAAGDRRFQIDPAAMQRAGRAATGFRISFAMLASLTLQRSSETRTLLRIIAKKRLQIRVGNSFCCLLKTLLTVFERFD